MPGTILIIEDISTRVQLEEQLQISEKMASIGLLAAGVAHEVNTPLTGISSFTQMLLQGAEPDDPTHQGAREDRAADVPRREDRQRPAQPGAARRRSTPGRSISTPSSTTCCRCSSTSCGPAASRCARSSTSSGLIVQGIEYKLQQVFLNLFLNARDAMPKGGWLTIATTSAATDDAAVVEIADTGSGIPADQLSRIYDPFFTTKDIGKGTGLGLSITYGIVQEHGGTITCDSAIGQGTRFTLALPLASTRELRRDAAQQYGSRAWLP